MLLIVLVLLGDEGLWYDCTSSEGSLSPVKSFADIENSHVSVKSTTPEEEAELLPHSTYLRNSLSSIICVLAYTR